MNVPKYRVDRRHPCLTAAAAVWLVLAASCERNREEPGGAAAIPVASPQGSEVERENNREQVANTNAVPSAEQTSAQVTDELLSKLPKTYAATTMLEPAEAGLIQGQVVLRFPDDDRATFWHLNRWGNPDMASEVAQRRDRVGPIRETHVLFNARFDVWVWAGSAPPQELDKVEAALTADEFVAWKPSPKG